MSHVNQAYDKYVDVKDKAAKNESLAMLRNKTFYNKGVVDQWGMIHVGLFVIHSTDPETWTNSFGACNLYPRTRVPLSEC
jgi:hypothetical protein